MLYDPDYGASKRKLTIGLLIAMVLLVVVPHTWRLLNQRNFAADFKL